MEDDSERWEDEGGSLLFLCERCGKMKPLFHDDLCIRCWMETHPH